MTDEGATYFERRIRAEIDQIEKQISNLETEKSVLKKQLAKLNAERTGISGIDRKNSLNRVLTWNEILLALRNSRTPIAGKILFEHARKSNPNLKQATFRTYLHRMKTQGLIAQAKKTGHWELPQTDVKSEQQAKK